MSDALGMNLADKNQLKSDMTEPDPEGFQFQLVTEEKLRISLKQIVGSIRALNDTRIVSSSGHVNSIIYSDANAGKLDDMETAANWSSQGAVTVTIAADSTAGHFWIGTQGTKGTWSAAGVCKIRSTTSYGDFSGESGAASGTPIQGTAGLWVYTPSATAQSGFILRIGSASNAYREYTAAFYGPVTGFTAATRHLLLFDLDAPSVSVGTPDWTAIDFVEIEWTGVVAGNVTFDYLTLSKSNSISLLGLGDRRITAVQFTQTTGL